MKTDSYPAVKDRKNSIPDLIVLPRNDKDDLPEIHAGFGCCTSCCGSQRMDVYP